MNRAVKTAALALLATGLMTAPASAAKKSLRVSVNYFSVADCSVAPDKVRMAVGFEAKVKAKNAKKPSKINVSYKLTNPQTGEVRVAESLTLKPNDYVNIGTFLGYTAGAQWSFDGSFTYKSSVTGKTVTSKTSQMLTVYTNDELSKLGVPSCV
ncbi:MAG: hypothetical protein HY827_09825 [Actinobacteria bacterium]|nr:hypothetical protein [Actinomycetota bacterium]